MVSRQHSPVKADTIQLILRAEASEAGMGTLQKNLKHIELPL